MSARAGGLYVHEFGTPSMGTASAGAQAVATDASTAGHNPAGMTRIEGNQFMLAGGLLYSDVHFDRDPATPVLGSSGGDAGDFAPMLGSYYVRTISERWRFGFASFTLVGAALDYDHTLIMYSSRGVTLKMIILLQEAPIGLSQVMVVLLMVFTCVLVK
jgi:long-chain fatty acid transport protein